MKTQLLQDIDESQPFSSSAPLVETKVPTPSRPKTQSVWKQRAQAEPQPPINDAGPTIGPTSAPPPNPQPDPVPEPAPAAAVNETAWPGKRREKEFHWFDRWGRHVATWSMTLAVISLIAGGGYWFYNETKLDRTLAVLAKTSVPARQASLPAPVAAPLITPPAPAIPTSPVPDLVLLKDEELSDDTAQAAAPPVEPAPPVASPKPRVRESQKEQSRPKQKAPMRTAASSAKPEPTRSQLAETLKQCRAMGYHATQCIQRSCTLTKFGLACRG